ncbi:MAG: hypothetical protein MAG794_00718 [Gammaproteobacteria bacterium]|nr:hypothetical protein [Gammaproteobacteria bacterium]
MSGPCRHDGAQSGRLGEAACSCGTGLGLLCKSVAGQGPAGGPARPSGAAAIGQGSAQGVAGCAPALWRLSGRAARDGGAAAPDIRHHRAGDESGALGTRLFGYASGWRAQPARGRVEAGAYGGALPELPDVDGRVDRPPDARGHRCAGGALRRRRHGAVGPHHPRGGHHRDLLHALLPGGAGAGAGGGISRPRTTRSGA